MNAVMMNKSIGPVWLAMITLALGLVGCGDLNVTDSNEQPTSVIGVMQSLKTELADLSSTHPELSEAGEIKVISAPDGSAHTTAYRKNCTFRGKQGYQDTGANACAVALRVMTDERFQKDVREVAMPAPNYNWPNLKLVGWSMMYVGKQPSDGFERGIRQVLGKHIAMINKLDTQAAAK